MKIRHFTCLVALLLCFTVLLVSCNKKSSGTQSSSSISEQSSSSSNKGKGKVVVVTDDSSTDGSGGSSSGSTGKNSSGSSNNSSKSGGANAVPVSSYIRNTSAKSIPSYQSSVASYKQTDPAYTTTYTDAQKTSQRSAGQDLTIQVETAVRKGNNYYKAAAGVYRYASGQTPFDFSGVSDFYLDISDCTFILEGMQRLIEIKSCDNVIVQGPATVDRDPLISVPFTVQSYDSAAKSLTVKYFAGYTFPTYLSSNGGNLQWFKSDGSMLPTSFISFSSAKVTNAAERIAVFYGVTPNTALYDDSRLVAGQIGANAVSGGLCQVIHLTQSRNIQIRDITNYGSGMMTYIESEYGPDTLDKLYNIRHPGTSRLVAGTAGQMEYIDMGPTITNCIFSFCEDDAIDIMGHSHFVYKQETANTVVIKPMGNYVPFNAGDTLVFYDPYSFNKVATAKVKSFTQINDSSLATTAKNLANNSFNYIMSSTSNCIRVTLDANVTIKQGSAVANTDSFRPSNVTVKNNYFHDFGCRVLIQGCNDLNISGNLIERGGLAGIALDCEQAAWTEGPGSDNVVISENTITDTPSSPYVTHWPFVLSGAISVGVSEHYNNGNTPCTDTTIFSNITIKNNTITNPNYSGILVKNANGVTVTGNTIKNAVTLSAPTRNTVAPGFHIYKENPFYGVYLFSCSGISIGSNSITLSNNALGDIRKNNCK